MHLPIDPRTALPLLAVLMSTAAVGGLPAAHIAADTAAFSAPVPEPAFASSFSSAFASSSGMTSASSPAEVSQALAERLEAGLARGLERSPFSGSSIAGVPLAVAANTAASTSSTPSSSSASSSAPTAPAASAATPTLTMPTDGGPVHPLARDHVNLVRVKGDRITDVVFDAQALEVTADKERGIVFVRIKPAWLQAQAGARVTAAFFNTETENHAVQFVAADVPSQTIELVPGMVNVNDRRREPVERALLAAFEAPLEHLEAHDFIGELKEMVHAAAGGQGLSRSGDGEGTDAPVGLAFNAARNRIREVDLSDLARTSWEGYAVRAGKAWVSGRFVCEALSFTNLNVGRRTLALNAIAETVPGVVALAAERLDLAPGEATVVYVIRARSALEALLLLRRSDAAGTAMNTSHAANSVNSAGTNEAGTVFSLEALGAADDAAKK